jgi:HEAT repeat protein
MLDSSDPRASESAKALASINDVRVISYFAEALRKFRDSEFGLDHFNESYIKDRAIGALALYDDDRAIEALQSAMNSPTEDTRLEVATAFGDSPHRSAVKLLLRMKEDSYWLVRLRVAQRLATVNTMESRAVLHKLLKDENEDVRKAATEGLKKINQ